ncbi:formamidopyrimidine 5-formyluracil 5-hydroxymethyluracil DNA glycosylase [Paucilactobacillus vaccinostercus DSM 20634]|uniref:Formamidopyrimidine-DNA glycosylase n=1 Tax=Paucilactobacillus vaccinostercus DSM 20634 TaxID=1423813 RepID=A0A0R2A5V7_9LACO|nr:bifunctional DNA-formamidopyrimidine glycosylase/DNA-(apurinic or apyrimidinic site) lyase [Paucilactobacillus vaccinostercus]KRM62127.1 formamidopyrimidine 5-formyluracil 5-hydroxymethyluracil DNA glycosylase [Paucilactobacillus vaccinostercus DSM 20634]
MPELPEVETVRRGLLKIAKGRKIAAIDIHYEKTITNENIAWFKETLIGATIVNVDRRGKYLLFRFDNQMTMVSHLRMEGKYYNLPEDGEIHKHTHVVFHLDDDTKLCYSDSRKFGRMTLVKNDEALQVAGLKTIGPEPTAETLTVEYLQKIMHASRREIKPFLLDQSNVAGLGNIYVDEVLWMSKIHPKEHANLVSDEQIEQLRDNIIQELAVATEHHGTTVHSYTNAFGNAGEFQNHLHAYGNAGKPCERCGTPFKKIKVAQRGTTYCPHCQILTENEND